jgi:hypothetical protein
MSASKQPPTAAARVWERGWEGHEQQQRKRMAELTLPQKLQWLEDAQQLVEQLAKSRQKLQTENDDPSGAV